MCVVKTKEQVVTGDDLQDLITCLISTKCIAFTKEELIQEAKAKLTGSRFENENGLLNNVIEKTIETLVGNDFMFMELNKYRVVA